MSSLTTCLVSNEDNGGNKMNFSFDRLVKKLGDGEVVRTATGKKIFKMSPFEGNPVVKPQDIGLSWHKDGKLQTGAVFNGGGEIFEGKVILLPRCQKNYQKKNPLMKNQRLKSVG